ncbi:MAG: hypothetical protein AAGA23_03755 [Pseudomonadota bacterium]
MKAPDHIDENVLTPTLLFALNVSLLIVFYLIYALLSVPAAMTDPSRTAAYLALFAGATLISCLALRHRQRWFLTLNIALHLTLYVIFFR